MKRLPSLKVTLCRSGENTFCGNTARSMDTGEQVPVIIFK